MFTQSQADTIIARLRDMNDFDLVLEYEMNRYHIYGSEPEYERTVRGEARRELARRGYRSESDIRALAERQHREGWRK